MRVLLTTDPVGGVWTFTRELSQELIRLGHTVHLLSFGRALSKWQAEWCMTTETTTCEAFTWTVSEAPLEWMQDNERTWLEGTAVLDRAVATFAPDVLHTNQFCFGATPGVSPRVLTAHSDVLSWAKACRPLGLARSAWLDRYRELVAAGLESADAVTAPTHWMAGELKRHFSFKGPVNVIANGRSVQRAKPDEPRLRQAVSAGRLWDEAKGLATLLEREWPVPIFVAGEENFGDAQSDTKGPVRGLGVLAENDLLAVMRQSAIYVAPSVYEPFGLAPLEAALCGCALVMRDLASFREVWGENALYFSDANDLAAQLNDLRRDEVLLGQMRQRAFQHAQRYDARIMAAAYLRVYEECAHPAAQRRSAWESDAA